MKCDSISAAASHLIYVALHRERKVKKGRIKEKELQEENVVSLFLSRLGGQPEPFFLIKLNFISSTQHKHAAITATTWIVLSRWYEGSFDWPYDKNNVRSTYRKFQLLFFSISKQLEPLFRLLPFWAFGKILLFCTILMHYEEKSKHWPRSQYSSQTTIFIFFWSCLF